MSSSCIHGFQQGQCASCNPVEPARPADVPAEGASEQREGWEIFYVPAVSGWRIRQPETDAGPDSYRSLFLARKAVDAMVANPPPEPSPKRRK